MVPPLAAQSPEQGGRELEGPVAEDRVHEELEAIALLGAGDGDDRVASILVGLVIARDRLAADELRGQGRAVAPLLEQQVERPSGPRPRVAVLDHACVEVLQELARQLDPFLAVFARVRPEIESIDVRIVVEQHIFIGRIDQVLLGTLAAIFFSSDASSPSATL